MRIALKAEWQRRSAFLFAGEQRLMTRLKGGLAGVADVLATLRAFARLT